MAKITKTKLDLTKKENVMVERQEYLFISRIIRFSKKGIQISRTPDGKGRFWVDAESFYNDSESVLQDYFNVGDAVQLSLIVECFINKYKEYVWKPCLKVIGRIDESEMQYWTHNQPTWNMKMQVVRCQKTDIDGLFILEGFRLDSDGNKQEKYFLRYFNKKNEDIKPGRYEVDFDLYTSSRIIQTDGEVFTKSESSESDSDKSWPVYVPYLEANHIYELVSSKE